ncbi:hypothetical protein CPJ18_13605 [Agrobacterium rosae]|uniref:Uncharacterized protein n=1 Tax=Agrobacterium rosae TaxID=1972867 RepID=A0AAE5RY34_9HYPH|nr:hypothetical protein DXM21_06750 [Agrobacterium rosae]KAA3523133.1 hypothetical protein DXM25_06760 [Agrobacterium rosae]MQB47863.1 hypothetical protein [Agrobacterium rosae]POO51525.1 hypothetical protein CPJ18_13605 [Agrobacterium rosae]
MFCKLLTQFAEPNVCFWQHSEMKQTDKAVISGIVDCKSGQHTYFQQRKRGGGSSVFKNTGMGQGMLSFSLRTQTLLKLDWRST